MALKKIITKSLLLLVIINSNFCFSQWIYNDTKNGIKITYDYKLFVKDKDSSISVSLKIDDNISGKTFNYKTFDLNSSNVIDSLKLSNLLKSKYSIIFKEYGKQSISVHSKYLSDMVLSVKDTILPKHQRSFVYQGMFMFQSLLNGANRDLQNKGDVNFSIMGSYPVAMSSFVCAEEVNINIDNFKSYLIERKTWDKENEGINYYLGALENYSGNKNMYEITNILISYFSSKIGWPQGGQCGCCGNYAGDCYYWNAACLAHDMACQRCQHSWCFSGCVASSCRGNTIAWYWWI